MLFLKPTNPLYFFATRHFIPPPRLLERDFIPFVTSKEQPKRTLIIDIAKHLCKIRNIVIKKAQGGYQQKYVAGRLSDIRAQKIEAKISNIYKGKLKNLKILQRERFKLRKKTFFERLFAKKLLRMRMSLGKKVKKEYIYVNMFRKSRKELSKLQYDYSEKVKIKDVPKEAKIRHPLLIFYQYK